MKINLSKDEIFFIDGDARGVSIRCDDGFLWVTQPNDSRDHILRIGKTFNVTRKGKVAVVAFKDSIVRFSKYDLHSNKKVMERFRLNPVFNLVGEFLSRSVSAVLHINVSHQYRRYLIKL
ncbi:MAG: DUF2917 domain-containing protein [Desulfobacteraceae bacterium]|nr:DUF2917 domain-containing protein [Desulfobacteraceae bacterium]